MDKQGATYQHINRIRRFYIGCRLTAYLLFAVAFALIGVVILSCFFAVSGLWFIVIFLVAFICLALYQKPWGISERAILNFLNLHYPQLQESGNLLLKPFNELNVLEQLQLSKIEKDFTGIPVRQNQFLKPLKLAGISLLLSGLFSFMLITFVHREKGRTIFSSSPQQAKGNKTVEKLLPQVTGVQITITPPAYTGKAKRVQDKFAIEAESSAEISWQIATNTAVKQVSLLFNSKQPINLKPNDDKTEWPGATTINQPGFYQLNIDGKLSDLYAIQLIQDQPPVIHIKTPQPYTYIDAGETPKVVIRAAINDDYGISNALIFATVAKGSGEAVKFKDYKLDAGIAFDGHLPQYNLQKLINLPALNMEPGDELYFYIQATDTHQQQSKTDVYTVSIQDTAKLLSMDGIVTGTDQKPEFFRSERQIILDSERLLKEKDSISATQFKSRSNDLATDQKLLRLRYGKFLGEESESDIGGNDNDAVSDINNFGNADVIRDKYTDKHDNAEDAEDAGFFEPGQKAQLKATLTEMWKAELQLRLYKPQDALAFEYKALRLLKDLQQKSRVYVAKTSYNPPPLKLEKRLSGDLSPIKSASLKQDLKPVPDQFESLRKAYVVLNGLKPGTSITGIELQALTTANHQLSIKAAAEPDTYLAALNALNNISSPNKKIKQTDITLVQRAIQKALSAANKTPAAGQNSMDMGLSQQYYKNLNRSQQ